MRIEANALAGLEGIDHAFFTRGEAEGASGGIYRGLNCGFGSADDAETVRANRARAMAVLDLPGEALATPHQIHSAHVITAESPDDIAGQKADAVVTARAGLPVGVLTADCSPLLFADPVARVVGAAHAGWRGARFGVAGATLSAMERLGAKRSRIRVAIGPTIGGESYEVGPEFATHFLSERAGNARFFRRQPGRERAYFDLPGYLSAQLSSLGILVAQNLGLDTVSDPGRFFSYRRSVLKGEPDYGRLLSAIVLRD